MTARRQKNVAVLISGRGSNMASLVEASREAGASFRIAAVIADNEAAAGLEHARAQGIDALAVPRASLANKAEHEAAIEAGLAERGIEIVCLAGYMRLLSPAMVARWHGRMLNIHPSLLPLFKGLDTHRRALEAGMRIHGCSVHFVTDEMDGGPIIAQAAVPILVEDDADGLQRRVLAAEHRLYPAALELVASGRARLEEGRTQFRDARDAEATARILSPAPDVKLPATDLELLARSTP